MSSSSTNVSSSARITGRVKWFNNKAGYGFITITDGSRSGSDIFVHHSVITVGSQQFRYLVQGEYVEFDLVPTIQGSAHDIQASNICGIKGGKLMCETRNEYKATKVSSTDKPVTSKPVINNAPVKMPRQKSITSASSDKETWFKVDRKQKK